VLVTSNTLGNTPVVELTESLLARHCTDGEVGGGRPVGLADEALTQPESGVRTWPDIGSVCELHARLCKEVGQMTKGIAHVPKTNLHCRSTNLPVGPDPDVRLLQGCCARIAGNLL
jgi:hypothetical protein